jgi:hypothetical protein
MTATALTVIIEILEVEFKRTWSADTITAIEFYKNELDCALFREQGILDF